MADIFCDLASGDDADDGSTRALAKKTLAAALTAAGAGGRVGLKNDHAESQASVMTLTSPGTVSSPTRIISIDWTSDTFASNAYSAGANVITTGASNIDFSGFADSYGVTYCAGTGAVSAQLRWVSSSAWGWVFADGGLKKLGTTGSTAALAVGAGGTTSVIQRLVLINTPITFGSVSDQIAVRSQFYWSNTPSAILGSVPTTLFGTNSVANGSLTELSGVDLSALGSGTNLFDAGLAVFRTVRLANCKLGSSVTPFTGTQTGDAQYDLINSDSGDTNYRYLKKRYAGEVSHESTIVRTGGATDGTTPISRKMVSSANSKFESPLFFDVMFWNESLSALSLAAEVVSDGVTFTNAELWMEVEYLGTSGFPVSSFARDRASNILSTPANQTSSSETWTTTGLSSPTKQKLEVSVTPAEKGWIRCRIYLAKASSTVYVCPLITGIGFTSGRQWQTADAYVLEGAAGGGGAVQPLNGLINTRAA